MDPLVITLIVINILLLMLSIFSIHKVHKFQLKNIEFMKSLGNGTNLEEMIKKYISATDYVNQENALIKSNIKNIETNMQKCIQKIGVVRYNAFDDVGSNLSFVVALLDNTNSGIIINGVYGRETTSVYAKPYERGSSSYPLSNEEQEAVNKAIYGEKN